MFVDHSPELLTDFIDGLIPGYGIKSLSVFLQGVRQPVGMVLMVPDVQPLAAHISLAAGVVLIPANLGNLIVLHSNLESAQIASQYTRCFLPLGHFRLLALLNSD